MKKIISSQKPTVISISSGEMPNGTFTTKKYSDGSKTTKIKTPKYIMKNLTIEGDSTYEICRVKKVKSGFRITRYLFPGLPNDTKVRQGDVLLITKTDTGTFLKKIATGYKKNVKGCKQFARAYLKKWISPLSTQNLRRTVQRQSRRL